MAGIRTCDRESQVQRPNHYTTEPPCVTSRVSVNWKPISKARVPCRNCHFRQNRDRALTFALNFRAGANHPQTRPGAASPGVKVPHDGVKRPHMVVKSLGVKKFKGMVKLIKGWVKGLTEMKLLNCC